MRRPSLVFDIFARQGGCREEDLKPASASHSRRRCPRRRHAAPRPRRPRARAEAARRLRRLVSAFARPLVPVLDGVARRWLMRSQSPYVEEVRAIAAAARLSRHLVPQRLVSMVLHGAGARRGRRALARAHARLAVSRARPLRRAGPHAGAGGRIHQRHLAGLCRRADRAGAGPLRRRHQPGADAPAQPRPSVRLYDLAANAWATLRHPRAIPPDQLLRHVFEQARDYDEAQGACWRRRRWRGR